MRVLLKSLSLWLAIALLGAAPLFAQGWHQQSPRPTREDLRGVATPDSSTIVAVGYRGTIVRSTDGGETWTRQASGTANWLRAVSFVDSLNGTAVGDNGTILHTTTGGE